MSTEKRGYPWYFGGYGRPPSYYDDRVRTAIASHEITLTGDNPLEPMVMFQGEKIAQVGLQSKQLFYQVLYAKKLTINLPSAHLNNPLVTSLLINFLPRSKYLENLTIKLTDSPDEQPQLERYGDILAAFRDHSLTIQSIEFQDAQGLPIDFQNEGVLLDESYTLDRSVDTSSDLDFDVTSGPQYVRLAEDPSEKPLANIFKRNKKDSRKRSAIEVVNNIAAVLAMAGIIFFPIYALTAFALFAVQSPNVTAFGAYGAAAMGACLVLAGIVGAIGRIAGRTTLTSKSRSEVTGSDLNTGIELDLQDHALVKAISNACREEKDKKATGEQARYELEYYHPQKGLTRERLSWKGVQERVGEYGIEVPGPLSDGERYYAPYKVYYHLPNDLVVEGTDDKDLRKQWLEDRHEFLADSRKQRSVQTEDDIGVLFDPQKGTSYQHLTEKLEGKYRAYKEAKGKSKSNKG